MLKTHRYRRAPALLLCTTITSLLLLNGCSTVESGTVSIDDQIFIKNASTHHSFGDTSERKLIFTRIEAGKISNQLTIGEPYLTQGFSTNLCIQDQASMLAMIGEPSATLLNKDVFADCKTEVSPLKKLRNPPEIKFKISFLDGYTHYTKLNILSHQSISNAMSILSPKPNVEYEIKTHKIYQKGYPAQDIETWTAVLSLN